MTVQPSARPTPDPATPNKDLVAPQAAHLTELRQAVVDVLPLLDFHRGHTLTKGDELNIDSVHERLSTAARLCEICGALDTKPYPAYPEIDGLAGFVDYLCDAHSDLARPKDADSSALSAGHRGPGLGVLSKLDWLIGYLRSGEGEWAVRAYRQAVAVRGEIVSAETEGE